MPLQTLLDNFGEVSIAGAILYTVVKGIPKFIELYISAQENIRKELSSRVAKLEQRLEDEQEACAKQVNDLWRRIEKMRQIIAHLSAKVGCNAQPRGISGILDTAFGTDPEVSKLMEELNRLPVPERGEDGEKSSA